MTIEIDPSAGFCFGVNKAISMAEEELKHGFTCSLGALVHNPEEIGRLNEAGLKTISVSEISTIKNEKVLIRTHGEPPETYKVLEENEIPFVDATCPIVAKLQQRIHKSSDSARGRLSQVLIYGKKDHAEVIALVGHSKNYAIVIETEKDLERVDFYRPIELYSQTTMTPEGLQKITQKIKEKIIEHDLNPDESLRVYNTICGHVTEREKSLRKFAAAHDLIFFVSGKESSNGNRLFSYCKEENKNSYFISRGSEINPEWLKGVKSIGISGSTSTPSWLMSKIKLELETKFGFIS